MKEGGKPRDEERRKAGKGKEGKKESHEGFDTQVRNISNLTSETRKMRSRRGIIINIVEPTFSVPAQMLISPMKTKTYLVEIEIRILNGKG